MASHGGRRAGAGRKPKAQKYAGPIRKVEKKIADRLPALAEKLITLAENGDREALIYLHNRILGKPTERLEAGVDVNLPIIAVEFVQPDHAEPAPGEDEPE